MLLNHFIPFYEFLDMHGATIVLRLLSKMTRLKYYGAMKIQTDKVLQHSRPDILVLKKDPRICKIIDVACPMYQRAKLKKKDRK